MNAGRLDRMITILQRTVVVDDVGDEQETWVPYVTLWAAKRESGAAEAFRNPQIVSELDAVFEVRHPEKALDATMRVEDEAGRLSEIRGIRELPGRRTGFEIMTRGLDRAGATVA
jgi:SPP1 family predicted phage head-tail adaptor